MSNGFIDWLQTVCDRIADQEEQGKALIESGDTAGYRAIMRKKAELLASLDKEGGVHLAALPAACVSGPAQGSGISRPARPTRCPLIRCSICRLCCIRTKPSPANPTIWSAFGTN